MLLAIHSYGGANEIMVRHWPYFLRSGASRIVGIGTEKNDCAFPGGIESVNIGDGLYMNGANLPRRLVRTVLWCLGQPEDKFVIAEYDTLFFKPLPDFEGVVCDRTGGQTWHSKATWFGHNPWCFDRANGANLVLSMIDILNEGHCAYGTPESSPDVFFAFACERAGITVKHDRFRLFSRNRFDTPGDLALAREAYRSGCDVIHGVKTKEELDFITT